MLRNYKTGTGNRIDITGQRFGRLTAIKYVGSKDGGSQYLCRCDCGNEKILSARRLRAGQVKSCGCLKHKPAVNRKDLTGKTFGRLTVTGRSYTKNNRSYWHCRCSCGNELDIRGHDLTTGNTTSCGCRAKEIRQEIDKHKEATRIDGVLSSALHRGIRSDNKTGVKGVYFDKRHKVYVVRIGIKNSNKYIGTFDNLADAAKARKDAEEKYFKPILDKENKKK